MLASLPQYPDGSGVQFASSQPNCGKAAWNNAGLWIRQATLQEKEIWSVCIAIKPLGAAKRSLSPKIKLWFKCKSFLEVLHVLKDPFVSNGCLG